MGNIPPAAPGLAWLDILQRPTLEAFASAFTPDTILNASVLRKPVRGPAAIREVFEAMRGMYGQIAFLHETRSSCRTYLEWEGRSEGRDIAGVTILAHDARGVIESIALHHRPYDQVVTFAAELARRVAEPGRG